MTFFPLSVVSGDGTMGGLSFQNIVGVEQDRGHETEGTESLSNDVGLNVSVIVFTGPNNSSVTLKSLSNHIINKSMLVIDFLGIELTLEFILVNLFEDILEETIVLLKNGVLG